MVMCNLIESFFEAIFAMQVQLHTQTETQAEGLVCTETETETDNHDWSLVCTHPAHGERY